MKVWLKLVSQRLENNNRNDTIKRGIMNYKRYLYTIAMLNIYCSTRALDYQESFDCYKHYNQQEHLDIYQLTIDTHKEVIAFLNDDLTKLLQAISQKIELFNTNQSIEPSEIPLILQLLQQAKKIIDSVRVHNLAFKFHRTTYTRLHKQFLETNKEHLDTDFLKNIHKHFDEQEHTYISLEKTYDTDEKRLETIENHIAKDHITLAALTPQLNSLPLKGA